MPTPIDTIDLNPLRSALPPATPLSTAEVDLKWQKLQTKINELVAWVNSNMVEGIGKPKTITATLVSGANTITHSIGAKARIVQFMKANGEPTSYTWKRDPMDELNKIIVYVPDETPGDERIDTEINIQAS